MLKIQIVDKRQIKKSLWTHVFVFVVRSPSIYSLSFCWFAWALFSFVPQRLRLKAPQRTKPHAPSVYTRPAPWGHPISGKYYHLPSQPRKNPGAGPDSSLTLAPHLRYVLRSSHPLHNTPWTHLLLFVFIPGAVGSAFIICQDPHNLYLSGFLRSYRPYEAARTEANMILLLPFSKSLRPSSSILQAPAANLLPPGSSHEEAPQLFLLYLSGPQTFWDRGLGTEWESNAPMRI